MLSFSLMKRGGLLLFFFLSWPFLYLRSIVCLRPPPPRLSYLFSSFLGSRDNGSLAAGGSGREEEEEEEEGEGDRRGPHHASPSSDPSPRGNRRWRDRELRIWRPLVLLSVGDSVLRRSKLWSELEEEEEAAALSIVRPRDPLSLSPSLPSSLRKRGFFRRKRGKEKRVAFESGSG